MSSWELLPAVQMDSPSKIYAFYFRRNSDLILKSSSISIKRRVTSHGEEPIFLQRFYVLTAL